MTITPLIIGSGRSGKAIAKSLQILSLIDPELNIQRPVILERGASLAQERCKYERAVLCIANPHGLHAKAIIEADQCGFNAILCEKPTCVNLEELGKLREVKTPTAILHVYRQMWGLQTLKEMIVAGKFGQLIAIEGRYWQSSAAARAQEGNLQARNLQDKNLQHEDFQFPTNTWKSDIQLSGGYDAYLDVGSHWIDAASFLFGSIPLQMKGWRSFTNAEAPHRDTHLQVVINYPNGRALASISKTFHGATNHFEMNVIGANCSATWCFLSPDEILIGEGRDRQVITRKDPSLTSLTPPHHGMGWLEGYVEITSRLFSEVFYGKTQEFPRLQENLELMETILKIEWEPC